MNKMKSPVCANTTGLPCNVAVLGDAESGGSDQKGG